MQKGYVWDRWFEEPIVDEENHLMANGYANSWFIDVDKICRQNNKCVKNPDGSYDFEMIVEFWPQRLFYLGLFISLTTLLACLSYLAYDYIKKKKVSGRPQRLSRETRGGRPQGLKSGAGPKDFSTRP